MGNIVRDPVYPNKTPNGLDGFYAEVSKVKANLPENEASSSDAVESRWKGIVDELEDALLNQSDADKMPALSVALQVFTKLLDSAADEAEYDEVKKTKLSDFCDFSVEELSLLKSDFFAAKVDLINCSVAEFVENFKLNNNVIDNESQNTAASNNNNVIANNAGTGISKQNVIALIAQIIVRLYGLIQKAMELLAKKNEQINEMTLKLGSITTLLGGVSAALSLSTKTNLTLGAAGEEIAADSYLQSSTGATVVLPNASIGKAKIHLTADHIDKIVDALYTQFHTNEGLAIDTSIQYIFPKWAENPAGWNAGQIKVIKQELKDFIEGKNSLGSVPKENAPNISLDDLQTYISNSTRGKFSGIQENGWGVLLDNYTLNLIWPLGLEQEKGSAAGQASMDNTQVMYKVGSNLVEGLNIGKSYKDEETGEEEFFCSKSDLELVFKNLSSKLEMLLGESGAATLSSLFKQMFSLNKDSFSSLMGTVENLKKQLQTSQSKAANQISELQRMLETFQQTFEKAIQLNGVK